MRLVTYRAGVEAAARLGAISDDLVVDLALLGAARGVPLARRPCSDLIDLRPDRLRRGSERTRRRPLRLSSRGRRCRLTNVNLLAPIPRPRKNIFGIGLNYLAHIAESAKALDSAPELPRQPVIFSKPPTTVIGPGESRVRYGARITQQLDWEVELAAIVGRTAIRRQPRGHARAICSATPSSST